MSEIKGPTLFIVGSPFQTLCMLEITKQYEIRDYEVLVQHCDDPSVEMISRLLNEHNIKYSVAVIDHIIKDVLPFLGYHRKYSNIFIGNYYCSSTYCAALLLADAHCTFSYFDDGTQALGIFSGNPRPRYVNRRVAFVVFLYKLLFNGFFKKEDFYTIYPVTSTKINIVHYRFAQTVKANPNGVYIIGTNSSALTFDGYSYESLLEHVISYLRISYPDQAIYYCPHRRDRNNETIRKYCETIGIPCFETRVSVEYDFIKEGICPYVVAGFVSNALFTLHSISSSTKVLNFAICVRDKKLDSEIKYVSEQMAHMGIPTISVI